MKRKDCKQSRPIKASFWNSVGELLDAIFWVFEREILWEFLGYFWGNFHESDFYKVFVGESQERSLGYLRVLWDPSRWLYDHFEVILKENF
jgi:hypothetical protein